MIQNNPAAKVKLKQVPQSEKQILTVDEQKRLEKVLLTGEKPLYFPILLGLYTGLRIGELIGLKESDFNYEKRELTVSRTVARVRDPNADSTEIIIGSTKTAKGSRVIPLPGFIAEMFREYMEKHREQRELLEIVLSENGKTEGLKRLKEGYIFITSNGNICEVVSMRTALSECLHKADVKHINFHALRHTFATRCSEAGFDAKTLSDILGHADTNITFNTYIHSTEKQKRSNMDKLKLLSK